MLRMLRLAARLSILLFVLVVGILPCAAADQPIQARIGNSVAVLTGPWKFHPGDDPAWAQEDFDDSSWTNMDLTPPPGSIDPVTGATGFVPGWTAHGFPQLTGYAWYRLKLDVENEVAAGDESALEVSMPPNFDDAYQVFVNGHKIGEFGTFTASHVTYYNSQPRAFPFPADVRNGPVTIAVRIWMDASTPLVAQDAGGLHGPLMLGRENSIEAMSRLAWDAESRTQIGNVLSVIMSLVATILGFTLFWLDRREPTYSWLAWACVVAFLLRFTVVLAYYTMLQPMVAETFYQDVLLTPLSLGLWAMFWAHWFRLERVAWIGRIAAIVILAQMIGIAMLRPPLYGWLVPAHASSWLSPVTVILKLVLGALLLWVCYAGIRKHARGAWLAVVPVLLTVLWQFNYELLVINFPQHLNVGGLVFNTGTVSNVVMLAIVSILLMQRFVRSQRDRELLQLEIEQARQVQQVLIPEALPEIAGFKLASEYRPAQQVGGDFFQILTMESGGVLAVIGDVSGKGTPAAMTVSLLVGTVRTLAHFTTSPSEIVQAMNTRMMGRMQGGFTTCLVLRVSTSGEVTTANAGHLAPYCDGKELAVEAGLPLGLAADAEYPESSFRLEPGQQLTLLTDGVIEARSPDGKLFGFERTAAMSNRTASSIAQAAQDYGQQDDVTVLTITRAAAGEEPVVVTNSTLAAAPSPA